MRHIASNAPYRQIENRWFVAVDAMYILVNV
jgi:hypothetical protein